MKNEDLVIQEVSFTFNIYYVALDITPRPRFIEKKMYSL